jgi:hypothetical protein
MTDEHRIAEEQITDEQTAILDRLAYDGPELEYYDEQMLARNLERKR